MSKLSPTAIERPVMGESEARAMRKRLFYETDKAAESVLKYLPKTRMSGVQRRGPLSRKIITAYKRYTAPVLINWRDGKRYTDFVILCPIQDGDEGFSVDGRLTIEMTRFDKKKLDLVPLGRMRVTITAHAIERLIQYFRVREFERLDLKLKLVLWTLVGAVHAGARDGKVGVALDDVVVGNLVMKPCADDPSEIVVVTWVGERSWSPGKKANIQRHYEEGLSAMG